MQSPFYGRRPRTVSRLPGELDAPGFFSQRGVGPLDLRDRPQRVHVLHDIPGSEVRFLEACRRITYSDQGLPTGFQDTALMIFSRRLMQSKSHNTLTEMFFGRHCRCVSFSFREATLPPSPFPIHPKLARCLRRDDLSRV